MHTTRYAYPFQGEFNEYIPFRHKHIVFSFVK